MEGFSPLVNLCRSTVWVSVIARSMRARQLSLQAMMLVMRKKNLGGKMSNLEFKEELDCSRHIQNSSGRLKRYKYSGTDCSDCLGKSVGARVFAELAHQEYLNSV